ncbi:MAG: beta-ketoacyl-ACP synthase III [Phycisphaeraceae bacterium JB051]
MPSNESEAQRATTITIPAGVAIIGTGKAKPGKVVTNDDLSDSIDTNDEWISQRTGIRQRFVVTEGQNIRTLAVDATNQAIANAGIDPTEIDLLICATMTPEMNCPNTGARIVEQIGATPAGAMDISAACSGFVYALNLGYSLIKAGGYKTVAVVGSEVLSKAVDWNDRRTCVLFGDGAGTAILQATDRPDAGCLYQTMGSNGAGWRELYIPRCDADIPENDNGVFSGTFNTLQMNGREVYKFAVSTFRKCVDQALKATGYTVSDLDMIVAHQSNARILESARDKLGLPEDKLYINIDRYANTSAASVPICLHELTEQNRLKQGNLVLFIGMGGGLTWGSSLWRL